MLIKRIKIFIILSVLLLLPCLLRLTQLQLLSHSSYLKGIAELKLQKGVSRQLKTIRGKILDRNGKILATDESRFHLHISYRLCSIFDQRVRQAKLLRATKRSQLAGTNSSLLEARKELQDSLEDLQRIIDKCTYFGPERADIEQQIYKINNEIWNIRTFVAWVRKGPDSNILKKYNHITDVPLSEAIADFEKKFPKKDDRLLLISKVDDISDMDKSLPLLELKTDDDIFTAQLEFMDVDGIEILPKAQRIYPHGSAAAQTIGWVGPPQEKDRRLLANDKLSSYLSDEVCGREDGVEYVCETILRGRRGEEVKDIDRQLVSRTETQFGKDVRLTLDIELQKKIEDFLSDCQLNSNCKAPTAAVVIDVNTSEVLALVSTPTFDLNRVRYDYDVLARDPNEPLLNRAINKGEYPPGSVVKPLILIAGLESGKITPGAIISCPAQKAPEGWPSCWLFNQYKSGHDYKWPNTARNAIRGSCNIYFSRLANRIDPAVLQLWLFRFGYGYKMPLAPQLPASSTENRESGIENRDFRQVLGQISSAVVRGKISHFEQIPPLDNGERRYFGIGQGNLRVTPLQVANAMAAIARGGVYKRPRLFIDAQATPEENRASGNELNISPQTLQVIYDGMSAVVNESSGTANTQFAEAPLTQYGVHVYGKTGSTQQPGHAWFAGFATDSAGRKLSIAVLVEGGQSGPRDVAPLAREILRFCINAGYLGQATNPSL
ncbi:MAG TPA: penicillin-binding transpeptidase domain-containing protein [Sedimentisphaerales bacterium]|nr:penicillin-binding transpeptidase domain-containing protein [Sedimentisphaerales bacterium]